MKKKIKVSFSGFWQGFNPQTDNVFGKSLNKFFDVDYVDKNSDLHFFSVYGTEHKKHDGKKVFFTPENFYSHKYLPLDFVLGSENLFKYADYSITSFDLNDERNFRLPCYVRRYGFNIYKNIEKRELKNKTKKILYLQQNCVPFRDNFVKKLQNYFVVDCPGNCNRNINNYVENKLKFLEDYKFVISFENSSHPGYNTEKLVDGFISMSVPIYWGDTTVHDDFNSDTFLNFNDYENESSFIDEIIKVDSNDEIYNKMILSNPIKNKSIFDENLFIDFIKKIVNN
jgi:hypothetical protein